MPSRFQLPHIDIAAFASSQSYAGEATGGNSAVRIREEHGRRVQNELRAALEAADIIRPVDPRLANPTGSFIEVELHRSKPADFLDMKTAEIRSSAAKAGDANDRTIALYVPDHARPILQEILDDYLNKPLGKKGNPPNKGKVEAIEAIRTARLETFWTDDPDALPAEPQHEMWWGLWCWRDREDAIETVCERLGARAATRERRLYFPEIVVVPVLATRATIELMLFATDAIAELRRANDNPVFFTDDVAGDQHEWSDDLAGRITWPGNDAPAVCIFDTGVNRAHPLIEPALSTSDLQAVKKEWLGDDHDPYGHGTAMAGMALHGDLTAALSDTANRRLKHRLESVKLLPPDGFVQPSPKAMGL